MAGFGAPRRGSRLPPSVLLVLLAVLGLLAFNYWSVRGRQAELATELGALQAQAERAEVARLRLERRNSELVLQVEEHRAGARREREQRGESERRLWRSQDRQIEMQKNMSRLLADISRLKEQLSDLNQAFLQREDQLHELQTNNTYLLNRLEQESQRYGEQIKELQVQYEAKAQRLPQATAPAPPQEPVGQVESSKENGQGLDRIAMNKAAEENLDLTIEATSKVHRQIVEEAVQGGEADAGMPEFEEDGAANLKDLPTALKKTLFFAPQVVQTVPSIHPQDDAKLVQDADVVLELKQAGGIPPEAVQVQPPEVHQQLHVVSSLKEGAPKKRNLDFQNMKQNRFFDENESPVDPQHGSKVADYNGDDGNVDDDDRDAQEDPADYRKDSLKDVL